MGLVKFRIVILLFFMGCTKAPITNRYQMITMPSTEEMALGKKYSKIILKRSKISNNEKWKDIVNHVGFKIANVVNMNYATQNYKWEFHVIENQKKSNAFCLSGGKVFLYTALFDYIENEDELAIVMGHEIAHALARHSAERKTSSSFSKVGNSILNFLDVVHEHSSPSNRSIPIERKWKVKMNKEMIEEWIMLPHSRTHEYEADEIGLVLSAKAGYNPNASLSFWKKFLKESSNKPEYLSTHPSPIHRIEKLEKLIPLVMPFYEKTKR